MAGAASLPAPALRPMPAQGPHVLILSPGSKVALTRALADAVSGRGGRLSGWEHDRYSPAAALCSGRVDGGPVEDDAAASQLLDWCISAHVRLVVPSRHDDLATLAGVADRFSDAGVTLAISSPRAIATCVDKIALHSWLSGLGVPVPGQAVAGEAVAGAFAGRFPLVAKDARGSGSRRIRICHHPADLASVPPDWIVQTMAPGAEFTINTYASTDGRCLCEIPHERLLTGDGEVVRGHTARLPALMNLARRITEALPGARGPLNIQIFWDAASQQATVIEVNPRFGGGYPLAHEAGGRFTDWLLAEYLDGRTLPRLESWEDRLMMVRYREAKFFRAG